MWAPAWRRRDASPGSNIPGLVALVRGGLLQGETCSLSRSNADATRGVSQSYATIFVVWLKVTSMQSQGITEQS